MASLRQGDEKQEMEGAIRRFNREVSNTHDYTLNHYENGSTWCPYGWSNVPRRTGHWCSTTGLHGLFLAMWPRWLWRFIQKWTVMMSLVLTGTRRMPGSVSMYVLLFTAHLLLLWVSA